MEKILKKNKKTGEVSFTLKPKYYKGELAKEILRGLAVGGVLAGGIVAPNVVQLLKMFESADRRKIKRVMAALKWQGLIRLVSRGEADYLEITRGGKTKLIAYDIDEMVLRQPKRWDGRWRVFLFDIPERFAAARRALKDKLSQLAFYPYQKSVYVTPYPCREEITFLLKFFGVEKHGKYLETQTLEDDLKLIHHFELSK